MNDRSLAEIDAAYLAALIDHEATFTVRREHPRLLRLDVRVYFKAEVWDALNILCGEAGAYSGSFTKLKRGGVVAFRNGEANTMLVAVWPYLKNPLRREQAQECFRFHKTQHGRGSIPLDHELKSIRLDVRRKLMALAGRA